MRIVLRSKLGLGLAAIRDSDRTAANSGVDVYRLKLHAFVIAAFVIGAVGAIFYIYQGYISPVGAFNVKWLMIALLATVIGGMRTEEGPIVGTIVVVFLQLFTSKIRCTKPAHSGRNTGRYNVTGPGRYCGLHTPQDSKLPVPTAISYQATN
jgi:ABC-type branched-subunit amino acid transport system permease subunit